MEASIAYPDLEKILRQGFLSLGLNYEGTNIVFKTLTEKELRNLAFYTTIANDKAINQYRMAFSTFMVDSDNILIDRNKKINELKDFYTSLPSGVYEEFFLKIVKLSQRYIEVLKFFEGFCYTDNSRYIWRVLNNGDPTKTFFTGIEGTDICGMNNVQENWISINKKLDEEELYEQEFNLSLMITSSMNSSGARSISVEHKNNRNELLDVRAQIVKYGYDKKRYIEEHKKSIWAQPIKTKEDLVRELNRQMSGEKDVHDRFMEYWIKKQKEIIEDTEKNIEKSQKKYRDKQNSVDSTKIEASRVATYEEVNAIKRRSSARGIGAQRISKFAENRDFIKKVGSVILRGD